MCVLDHFRKQPAYSVTLFDSAGIQVLYHSGDVMSPAAGFFPTVSPLLLPDDPRGGLTASASRDLFPTFPEDSLLYH